jgi:hypothetical protein
MAMENWSRICPECGDTIIYKNKYKMNSDSKKGILCKLCRKKYRKKTYSCFNKLHWIDKGYSEKDAIKKVFEIQSKISKKRKPETRTGKNSPFKKETWIAKGYSEEEAIKKSRSFNKLNKEYWIAKGYSEEEAIKNISLFQQSLAKRKKKNDDILPNQYKYWIKKGYSEEEAKAKVCERQSTFTLEKCKQKYGIEKGTIIFNERQRKWKQKIFNKYGSIAKSTSSYNIMIAETLMIEYPNILFGKDEKFIYDNVNERVYKYDICDPISKK